MENKSFTLIDHCPKRAAMTARDTEAVRQSLEPGNYLMEDKRQLSRAEVITVLIPMLESDRRLAAMLDDAKRSTASEAPPELMEAVYQFGMAQNIFLGPSTIRHALICITKQYLW